MRVGLTSGLDVDVEANPWRAYNVVVGTASYEKGQSVQGHEIEGHEIEGHEIVISRGSVDKGSLLFRVVVAWLDFIDVVAALDSERAWTAMALR
jgi:hypothetical protein